MSQISKCPKVIHVLTYWEALVEVSELSYKSLLYFSSNGSYCSILKCVSMEPYNGMEKEEKPDYLTCLLPPTQLCSRSMEPNVEAFHCCGFRMPPPQPNYIQYKT